MNTSTTSQQRRSPPFFAIGLIFVGILWLLFQVNVITGAHLSVLVRMWPLLLVGIGLELLFGRSSRALSTLIVVGTMAVLLLAMLIGPSVGLAANTEVTEASYNTPLDGTDAAQITVSVGIGSLYVTPLESETSLFDANIRHIGDVQYTVEEGSTSIIRLQNESNNGRFNIGSFFSDVVQSDNNARWDVGISPLVPLDLTLETATGSTTADLSGMHLTALEVESGLGSVTLTLPASEQRYDANLSLGTGEAIVHLEAVSTLNLTIDNGTGGATIYLPENAAVRLRADTGIGGIDVPGFMERTTYEDDSLGDQGVWETESYATARESQRIDIDFSGGTGGLTVR